MLYDSRTDSVSRLFDSSSTQAVLEAMIEKVSRFLENRFNDIDCTSLVGVHLYLVLVILPIVLELYDPIEILQSKQVRCHSA
jgi:hypothetical protein